MRGMLKGLFLLPVAVLLVLFGVANRQIISLSFDPFNGALGLPAFSVPVFALFFVTLAIGVVVGYVAAWLAQGRHRKSARQLRRECERLRGECARLRENTPNPALALAARG